MGGVMAMVYGRRRGRVTKTGQTTTYHVGDDGAERRGLTKQYQVLSTGQYSGTVNVVSPGYAAATIAFVAATKKITDTANGLATFKTADTIVVRGSASNDGVYTVALGNVAGEIVVNEALVNEAASRYVSICKREAKSNNCALDLNAGLMWARYVSASVGPTSNGQLVWYDATKVYTLHPAAADLQMIASSRTLRIVAGAGESARYHVGDCLVLTGFANAVNNMPGYVAESVTVNGADLDIVLDTCGATLVDEAAAGARTIGLECQSIFSYCAACNVAQVGGYTDWRVPNRNTLILLSGGEAPTGVPNAVAFPGWPASPVWASSTRPNDTTNATNNNFGHGSGGVTTKTTVCYAALVRG